MLANRYEGVKEVVGKEHNPEIVAWLRRAGGIKINDDETAWCSAFVYHVAWSLMLPLPHVAPPETPLRARSWLTTGKVVPLEQAVVGFDICILNRGGPQDASVISAPGHVAFFAGRQDDNHIKLLGGNQGNQVKISVYPATEVLGVRRLYG